MAAIATRGARQASRTTARTAIATRQLEERRVAEREPGGGRRQRGPEGRGRRGPEDDGVLVGRQQEQSNRGRARGDGGDELRPHVRLQHEPRGAPDREERHEVDEVPVLDELPRCEAEIERGDLKDEQRDEREQERCKGMCVAPAPVDSSRHEPRGREDDREDSDAERDLVEMFGGRAPQAVRYEIALERDDVVADDAPEPAERGEQSRDHGARQIGEGENAMRRDDAPDARPHGRARPLPDGATELVEDQGER